MSYEINLIEGERGKLHVTSDDARTENALMLGVGRKIFNIDNAFEASMPDNNTVRITSGVLYDNGMFIRIDRDQYAEVTIDNGLAGTYRHDLICIRYERNIQTQLESASIVVKKGEASEISAVDPEYTEGDVLDLEVHLDEFPLYRVVLNGLSATLEPMFIAEDVISNIDLYNELIGHIQEEDTPGSMHIPAGGENMQILRWAQDGAAVWDDERHVSVTKSTDSTSKVSPSSGGTFTAVDSVTRDSYGHVTKVNTKTVTLPNTSVAVDSELSSTSTNPVQNKAVTNALVNKSIYGDTFVSLGRDVDSTVGTNSFVVGYNSEASGSYSHAEGLVAVASGKYSHAEGSHTTASGETSHAEGYNTAASGKYSHAEGYGTKTQNATGSHAEGYTTAASGNYSHAEGYYTTASNFASHVGGKYNVEIADGGAYNNTTGHAFVIGNGTSYNVKSNAFSIMYSGVVKAASTITASTTADYAEFFEWEDGNPYNEDRVGRFVTINGNKISIASSNEDYILGIVSGEPFVLGNGDCDTWNGMYLRDEFGRTILEPAPKIEINEETGKETQVYDKNGDIVYEGTRPVLNPNYDPDQTYVSRFDRPEWSPVGMLGVLSVIQDGTCLVNGYCCCNAEGIATACDKSTAGACRITEILSDTVVRVIYR